MQWAHVVKVSSKHVATALQRGDNVIFLTTDHILSKMNLPKITFINN